MSSIAPPTRRQILAATIAAGAAAATAPAAPPTARRRHKICVFTKPFQSLSYDELADRMAELGLDGIEAPIRDGGHIEPKAVEDELPKMIDALKKRKLEMTVMTSSINRADKLSEKVLRTAAGLGVKRYRMKYYAYDLTKPVLPQLDALRPVIKELAALNKEVGISAVYQNHAGAKYVGAPIWDLHRLIESYPVEQIGAAFDIRHATVEGGTTWPLHFNLMQPHLGVVYVKDFRWFGPKVQNVPLGKGQVDPKFFQLLKASDYRGPISLHEEYIDHRDPKLVPQHLTAIRKDLATLRKLLQA